MAVCATRGGEGDTRQRNSIIDARAFAEKKPVGFVSRAVRRRRKVVVTQYARARAHLYNIL